MMAQNRKRGGRIPPLHNEVFLRVFGSEGGKPAAVALANAFLRAAGEPGLGEGAEVAVAADGAVPGGAVLKSPRLDVVLRCERRIVDIEAERRAVDVEAKSLFYASKLIAASAPRGADPDYRDVPEVAVITLLDGRTMFEGEAYLSVCRPAWERGGEAVAGRGNPLFIVAEMEKVRARYNRLDAGVLADELASWLYLLASGYEDDEEVERMGAVIETVEDFAREYGIAADDPQLRRYYERWQESELEWHSSIHFAVEQRLAEITEKHLAEVTQQVTEQVTQQVTQEVTEQVTEQRNAEIAENLRGMGLTEEQIAKALVAPPR